MSRDFSSTESTLVSRRPSKSPSCFSSDADVILTRRQQKLIFQVWDSIPNHSIFWQSVYIQLFMHKPSLKSLFRFRDQPVDRLRYDESFNRQCYVIQNFMRKVVGLLRRGEFEQLESLCRGVGRRHAHLTKIQFAGDWWPLFVSSTLDQLKPRCKSWCQGGGRSASWSSSGPVAGDVGSNGLLAAVFSQWPLRLGVYFSTTTMMIIGGKRTKFDEVMEAWRIFLEYVVNLMSNEFYSARAEQTREKEVQE